MSSVSSSDQQTSIAETGKLPFSVKFLIGLVCIPMGMIGSVTAKLFLDPDITPDAAMYLPLLAVVVGIHLALFGSGIAALATRLSKPVLNWIVLQSLMGYGLMSALLAVALR